MTTTANQITLCDFIPQRLLGYAPECRDFRHFITARPVVKIHAAGRKQARAVNTRRRLGLRYDCAVSHIGWSAIHGPRILAPILRLNDPQFLPTINAANVPFVSFRCFNKPEQSQRKHALTPATLAATVSQCLSAYFFHSSISMPCFSKRLPISWQARHIQAADPPHATPQ